MATPVRFAISEQSQKIWNEKQVHTLGHIRTPRGHNPFPNPGVRIFEAQILEEPNIGGGGAGRGTTELRILGVCRYINHPQNGKIQQIWEDFCCCLSQIVPITSVKLTEAKN
ncbi:hypothetical protein R3P38DRAFT_2812384 [Favolaschia claudopus]|uniref:Uncharacterized protein n=1 Tax=Favolaschia claudopus TaxID=2862362 RepID=A0AAV9Z744_9AGAR